jgi:hypothetical protein
VPDLLKAVLYEDDLLRTLAEEALLRVQGRVRERGCVAAAQYLGLTVSSVQLFITVHYTDGDKRTKKEEDYQGVKDM